MADAAWRDRNPGNPHCRTGRACARSRPDRMGRPDADRQPAPRSLTGSCHTLHRVRVDVDLGGICRGLSVAIPRTGGALRSEDRLRHARTGRTDPLSRQVRKKMSSNALPIRTPEGIVFSQTLAGPVLRFFAWLIDGLCVMALMSFLTGLIRVFGLVSPGMVNAVLTIAFFVLNFGVSIFFEWAWRGQTIGKKLLGLRVVDAEGMRLQFDQVVTRNLIRLVDLLPLAYVVGGLSCWLSRKCQRLGDIAANTIVVRIPVVTE